MQVVFGIRKMGFENKILKTENKNNMKLFFPPKNHHIHPKNHILLLLSI